MQFLIVILGTFISTSTLPLLLLYFYGRVHAKLLRSLSPLPSYVTWIPCEEPRSHRISSMGAHVGELALVLDVTAKCRLLLIYVCGRVTSHICQSHRSRITAPKRSVTGG